MSPEVFLSATANGVYQGLLVAALVGLILRLFRTNAATRYAVWFGTLLLVAALIPAHLFLACRSHVEIPPPARYPALSEKGNTGEALLALNTIDSPGDDTALQEPQSNECDADSMGHSPSSFVVMPPDGAAVGEVASDGGPKTIGTNESSLSKPKPRNFEAALNLPHSICLGLVSVWILISVVRGGLIARRLGDVRRVKKSSYAASEGLQSLFDGLRDSLRARRNVRLSISSTHRMAVVLGFIHPAVLLPAEMNENANGGEVVDVLRHELAHVERWDDWGNLAQHLIQGALFFHPAIWWVSAKLALEREIACDDHVLEASGRPRSYALTLANVASRMSQRRHLLAPGVSNNNSQLQKRVTMILNTHRDRSPRLAKSRLGFFTTATALLAVLAIDAGPRLVLAQTQPPAPDVPVAVEQPAALPPNQSGDESGPRAKPGATDDNDVPPAPPQIVAAALPPPQPSPVAEAIPRVRPVAPVAELASADEVESVPAVEDFAPEAPEPPHARSMRKDTSVEERLDRIERTLEKLQARMERSGNRHVDSFSGIQGQSLPRGSWSFSGDDFGLNRIADQARISAEAAKRGAEAGQRQAERAMRDMAKLNGNDFERMQKDKLEAESKASLMELQALRNARQSLDKEMGNLDQQIQRLEQDMKKLKKDVHKGRSDDSDDEGPKAKTIEGN